MITKFRLVATICRSHVSVAWFARISSYLANILANRGNWYKQVHENLDDSTNFFRN